MNEELNLYDALLIALYKYHKEAKAGDLKSAYKASRIVDAMLTLQCYGVIKTEYIIANNERINNILNDVNEIIDNVASDILITESDNIESRR